jgi:hypothetical protein
VHPDEQDIRAHAEAVADVLIAGVTVASVVPDGQPSAG